MIQHLLIKVLGLISLVTIAGTSQPVLALDLDLYGEQSSWIYDVDPSSMRPSFEDSGLFRIRGLALDPKSSARPYVLLSAQRERVNKSWGYERQRSQIGLGVRFFNEALPIRVFIETRHYEELTSRAKKTSQGEELAAIVSFSGHVGTHGQDDLLVSWYGDLSQVSKLGAETYASGSGWFRVSAVSLGSRGFHFEMNPFDSAAYRECAVECQSWAFVGVGLASSFQYYPINLSFRANFGERFDFDGFSDERSRDAARFLLLISGEL